MEWFLVGVGIVIVLLLGFLLMVSTKLTTAARSIDKLLRTELYSDYRRGVMEARAKKLYEIKEGVDRIHHDLTAIKKSVGKLSHE